MSTITITARELTSLVASVVPHASKDATLPLLSSVFIRSNGSWVTAIATDRYRMAFKRITPAATPGEDFAAVLPLRVLARIRSVFAANRTTDPAITLTIDGTELHVTTTGALDGITGASFDFRLWDEAKNFPNVDRILRDALDAETASGPVAMSVNPHHLADFRLGHNQNPQLILTPTGDATRPWLVRVGADFIGLVVPIRHGGAAEITTEVRDGWTDLLTPADPVVAVAA